MSGREPAPRDAGRLGGRIGGPRPDRSGRSRPEPAAKDRATDDPADDPTRTGHLVAAAYQQCINPACAATFAVDETHFACPACGDLLDVVYDWDRLPVPRRLAEFEAKWADRSIP